MPRSQLPANASRLIALVTVVIFVTILYFASDILVPLSLAVLFTFVLAPVVGWLERLGVKRTPAVLVVVVACCLVLLVIGWGVVRELGHLADNLDRYRDNIATKVESLNLSQGPWAKLTAVGHELQKRISGVSTQPAKPATVTTLTPTGVTTTTTQPTAENPVPVSVVNTKRSALQTIRSYFDVLLGPLALAGLVIVLVIFLLIRREDMRDRIIKLVAHDSLTVTTQALDDAGQRISRYLLVECIINGSYGVLLGIGLWIIGIPSAFLWGLFTAILRFVPYIGVWIAAFFPLALSLAVFPGYQHFIYTALLFIVIEVSTVNFIEPRLYGSSTGMSEVAILLAAVFWTWLWGPIGLLLTMPLTTVLVVMGKYIPQLSFLNTMLGDQPVLAPHMRYYQRLLAMDQEESRRLVEQYLHQLTLEDVYDRVMIPAVALAQEDIRLGHLGDQRQKYISRAVAAHIGRLGQLREELVIQSTEAPPESELRKIVGKLPRVAGEAIFSVPAALEFHATPVTGSQDIRVLCMPAESEYDALIGQMIAQCLRIRGFTATALDSTALVAEIAEIVATEPVQLIAVSALPPDAVRRARYLCKRLQPIDPNLQIVVGLWNSRTEPRLVRRRISAQSTVHVVTTLCSMIAMVDQLARPIKIRHGS